MPSRGTRVVFAWVGGRAGDGFDKTFAVKSFSGIVKGNDLPLTKNGAFAPKGVKATNENRNYGVWCCRFGRL